MKTTIRFKRACEEYSMEKVIGGEEFWGRFQAITNRAVKEKIEEKTRKCR